METSSLCSVCGQKASLLCSACRAVCYCSKQHQTSHWKEHKLNCSGKPYQIEWDDSTGHHLVARKDLEAGTFILQEQPLMVGGRPRKPEDKKVCLGCYEKVSGRGVDCPGCKWPLCGKKKCWEEGSEHALGECSLLKGARQRIPANYLSKWDPGHVYQSISVLRFLSLKEHDPSKWKELMSLKRCLSPLKVKALEMYFRAEIVPIVNQFLSIAVPEKWIISILTSLTVNTFGLPDFMYVYSIGSLFDNSCMANAEHTFTKSGKLLVRSVLPIAKGSKITLSYTERETYCCEKALLGTQKRLESLEKTRFIGMCQCKRCSDPTELGTFTSGIFCAQCPNKEGILLPKNPLEKDSDWACNKCSVKKSAAFITHFLENDVVQLVGRDRANISYCNAFIQKYRKALHPNHYLMTGTQMMLCLTSALAASELEKHELIPEKELAEREAELMKLLALADVLSPGLSRLRGNLLFNLIVAQITRLRKSFEGVKIMPDGTLSKLEALQETAREAYNILYWGPEIDNEDSHAEATFRICKHVEMMISKSKLFTEHGVFDPNTN